MTLQGHVDEVSHRRVVGWAWDADRPEARVSIVITANGEVIGRCLANRPRADLVAASIGDGRHAFIFELPRPLSPLVSHDIAVQSESDGGHLRNSPTQLEATRVFGDTAQEEIARLLSIVAVDPEDLERRLAFLADQSSRLRQIHADHASGAAERGRRKRLQWQEPDAGIATATMSAGHARPRALVIDDEMPRNGHDAGSNAIVSHMQSLRRLGYDVTFAPATLRGDGADLGAAGIKCCLHPWYVTIEEVLQRQSDTFDLVYLHRRSSASRYVSLARHYQPKAHIVYSVADLHFVRVAREAAVENRFELQALSEQIRFQEISAARAADAVITHSPVEAGFLRRHLRAEKIHVVPWAVQPKPIDRPFDQRRGVAFIGNFGHLPNVDAAHWLIAEIMPKVWELNSAIPCLLVGGDMPDSLIRLRTENIVPIGLVDDLSTVFARIRLTVAPLAFGAGIKGKVLDSLAAGIPCVCTPTAAEGLGFPEILRRWVAASPTDLARAIVAIHSDEALNTLLGQAGLALVRDFGDAAKVDALLAKAVAARASRG